MINRIKNWDIKNLKINDKQVISLALIFSIMALVMAIPSSSNCASANTCTVASTGTFTGNLGIRSNTVYQLTQQHNLAVDQIANWESVGGNHTGSVIMKDNNGDFNLNGGLVLGTSSTSTLGTVRFSSDKVQVLNSTGSYVDVGGTPTNDIGQVTGDTGSFTAATQQDNINVVGGTGITTSVTGDTLTIASSGGGTPMEFFGFATGGSLANGDPIQYDQEYYDTSNCFTSQGSPNYTYTYTCSDTRVFKIIMRGVAIDVSNNTARMQMTFKVNSTSIGSNNDSPASNVTGASAVYNDTVCLNQNDTFHFTANTSNTSSGGTVIGGKGETNMQLSELLAFGTSQSCTNGRIN